MKKQKTLLRLTVILFLLLISLNGWAVTKTASTTLSLRMENITELTNLGAVSTAVSAGIGKVGGGLIFNGSDEVTFATNADLKRPFSTGQITMSAWIKVNSIADVAIVAYGSGAFTYCMPALIFLKANGSLVAGLQNPSDGEALAASGTSAITAGVWYHVAVTVVSGSRVNLYINGALANTISTSRALSPSSDVYNLQIGSSSKLRNSGADFCGSSNKLNGTIDELRIFSRALSESEIRQLMLNFDPGEY